MLPSETTAPQITILTTTWNRRHLLPRLYQSLVEQEVPPGSFEWVVVDDGSEDGTIDWLLELQKASKFHIRVLHQENSGKCAALNFGAPCASGLWIIVVDSDDLLIEGSMIKIREVVKDAAELNAGVAYCLQDNKQRNHWFTKPEKIDKFSKWLNSQKKFDTVQIVRSDIFKKNPYPIFLGEKYFPESWLFNQIDKDDVAIFRNVRLVRTEYLPTGLSDRSRELRAASPLSMMTMHLSGIESSLSICLKARSAANYYRYLLHANRAKKMLTKRLYTGWMVLFPLGCALFIQDLILLRRYHIKVWKKQKE